MKSFWLCFIPLFVAVDSFGILPLFMGMTEGVDETRKRRIVVQSVITALSAGLVFLLGGKWILRSLGITIPDFMVAGGIVLFVLSVNDLLFWDKRHHRIDAESLGAVPIGVPLIVGPAVLTTGILLVDQFGFALTATALCLNVLIAGTAFYFSSLLERVLGKTGSRVMSKLAALLLSAFAVMMVRKGMTQILG
jgi:multiple antibiotic resistance protein